MSWTKFQVQKTLIDAYLSINASMMQMMAKAETAISAAQDRNKESPFIDSALEQIKIATTELNNAMKRVSEKELFWESKHCNFHYCLDFWSLGDNEQKQCPGGRQIFWEQIKEAFQIFFQEINEDKNWTLRERGRESAFFCNVLSDKIQNNSLCQGLGFER